MTLTAGNDRLTVLEGRLVALRAERDQALAETRAEAVGDVVDRATNVEASIRQAILEERIAALELEIAAAQRHEHVDGVVSVGDTVSLDFGDGPESFTIGSVEQAVAGLETITPTSALGRAIIGATVGETVSYSPRKGVTLSAKILETA
ncbi:GreA/GreB family elongation factor [Nocardioides litoris]|uniref:GreA/GreB family elongation factor n=1 Tax=Nocardioides litoris TaxID=1926648 RepID=UPI001122A494|nr:GreA/GreB family elongation factor [Nocardioides litoris]